MSKKVYELTGIVREAYITWAWVDVSGHLVRCTIPRFVGAHVGDEVIVKSVVVDDSYCESSTIFKNITLDEGNGWY